MEGIVEEYDRISAPFYSETVTPDELMADLFNLEYSSLSEKITRNLCAGRIKPAVIAKILDQLRTVQNPMPNGGFLGSALAQGTCIEQDKRLGDQLIRLTVIANLARLYGAVHKDETKFSRAGLHPLRAEEPYLRHISDVPLEGSYSEWSDWLDNIIDGPPERLAKEAEKLLVGEFTFPDGTKMAASPIYAVDWMTQAGFHSRNPATIIKASKWGSYDIVSTEFSSDYVNGLPGWLEARGHTLRMWILNDAAARGVTKIHKMIYCLQTGNGRTAPDMFEWATLMGMRLKGVEIDEERWNLVESTVSEEDKQFIDELFGKNHQYFHMTTGAFPEGAKECGYE